MNFSYQPLYKPNQLICGKGDIVIITGWTVKQSVSKHFQPEDFAAIGQLYSPTRGINFLIRNLLYNPHVQYLIILNATKEDQNAGGCQCLLDFFKHGFTLGKSDLGKECWLINSPITGYIDLEIPADILESLRQNIVYQETKSIAKTIELVNLFNQKKIYKESKERLKFTENNEVIIKTLPSNKYGHRIEGKTIAETWVKIIHRIKTFGEIRPTNHDAKWQELINLMAVITDEPDEFYFTDYLPVNQQFLQDYISQILDDCPQQEGVKYTYGQRLRSHFEKDQIEGVINKLVKDIDSARAVMSLWDAKEDINSNNPPCLNHIWIRVQSGELSLTATLRSNDMFSAWVANAMGLRALQKHIKTEIEKRGNYQLKMGYLITISNSAHIYDDCWENAEKLIAIQYAKIAKRINYYDPVGNFLITVQDHQIMIEQTTPGSGEIINCFQGKNAPQLYREMAANYPNLQIEHALYLGCELQKAEIAMKMGIKYEQDKNFTY